MSRDGGFAMTDALTALALAAASASALMAANGAALRASNVAEAKLGALAVARHQLANAGDQAQGETYFSGRSYRWRLNVEDAAPAGPRVSLRHKSITVAWGETDARSYAVDLDTAAISIR